MELKSLTTIVGIGTTEGSNRTFMELKLVYTAKIPSFFGCSNRTFMELKWWKSSIFR